MSEQPPRRRRRHQQPPHPPVVPGDQDLAGTREAYRTLAAQMNVVSWSRDDVVPEREQELWDTLRTLGLQRGLPVGTLQPAQAARPIGSTYRTGARQRYRILASQLHTLADQPTAEFLERERALWADIQALGTERGVIGPAD